jgi:hypothetical protein
MLPSSPSGAHDPSRRSPVPHRWLAGVGRLLPILLTASAEAAASLDVIHSALDERRDAARRARSPFEALRPHRRSCSRVPVPVVGEGLGQRHHRCPFLLTGVRHPKPTPPLSRVFCALPTDKHHLTQFLPSSSDRPVKLSSAEELDSRGKCNSTDYIPEVLPLL